MSEDKTKVRDLATQMDVQPKEVLTVLHELGVQAKNATSVVPAEYVEKVRDRMAAAKAEQAGERREGQPTVIVRRRRASSPEEGDSAGTETTDVAEATASAVTSPPADAEKPADADTSGRSKQPRARVVDTPARIVTPSNSAEPLAAVATPALETVEAVAAPVTAPAPQSEPVTASVLVSEPDHSVPATPEPRAEVHAELAAEAAPKAVKPEHDDRRKRQSARVVAPAAKVISRPADEAEAAKVAEAAKAAEAAKVAEAAKTAEAATIAEATKAAEAARGTETAATAATLGDVQPDERTSRKIRPAASALPEGSSAPSLLPPVSENREPRADGDDDRRPRRQDSNSAPQVRIISRPDPSTVRRPDPAAARTGDPRDNNAPRGPRPAGPGGYAPRPAGPGGYSPRPAGPGGYAPRPAGPGGPRPAGPGGPGGAPRPAGPGGFTPAPDGESRDGQSKKKRNKNRRTVDFQQGDAAAVGRRREDDDSDMPRSRGRRRSKGRDTRQLPQSTQPLKAAKRKIRVDEAIRVADMAHQMGLKSSEIIKVLLGLGMMATINKALDVETATIVAAEFGYEVDKVGFVEEDYLTPAEADAPENLKRRPPVVTIMGHVDHGKTSLLDAIRKTNVTGGEAGGITQHIGAYHVKTKSGEIVFLDTPGHEAFTAMRARGAQVTDLVVLVVAADDGVMEQTREAVNHSRAAGVPIMVAVNKMDKMEANPDRVLRELSEVGLVAEDWGGDTVVSKVSAKTRDGLDELLELLALQADIMDLKANPDKPARGHIVEAKLDKGRGPVATVLIQEGTLHQGDTFVCGVFSGRVRALFNDQGRKVKEAGPSIPVEVQGFDGVPEAGEEFICLTDEKLARRIADTRAVKQRERELAKESRVTLETFLARKSDDQEVLNLNLVVKADVQGSLEAIIEALNKQSTDKVRIQVIHGGAGAITESDIILASASDAIVIGFNVRPTAKVKEVADHENVDVRFYDIIYKLVDEIKSAMAGLLAPISREVYLGQAEVRQVFSVPKIGAVAGCHISDGKFVRSASTRLLRDGVVVHTGKLASLKRFKDDVREVMKGYECGLSIENYNDIKVGDVVEAFEFVTEAATL